MDQPREGATYNEDEYRWYLNGRPLVHCDEGCRAYNHPDMNKASELADAYIHWREHDHLAGCSHGR